MHKLARIHLVCGPIGAGKSTYANRIDPSGSALVFTLDQWMAELFGPDMAAGGDLKTMNPAWFAERVDRCERRIFALSTELLRRGATVVWDFGFLRRARRDRAREQAAQLQVPSQLHSLTADVTTRRDRVAQRNAGIRPGDSTFHVTPEMFAFAEHIFEPLDSTELRGAIEVAT